MARPKKPKPTKEDKLQMEAAINELQKYHRIKTVVIPGLKNKLEYLDAKLTSLSQAEVIDFTMKSSDHFKQEDILDEKIITEHLLSENIKFVEYIDSRIKGLKKLHQELLLLWYCKEPYYRPKAEILCDDLDISPQRFLRQRQYALQEYVRTGQGI